MTLEDVRRLQGTNALLQTGIAIGASKVLDIQMAITHAPYAVLRQTGALTCLVDGIEVTHLTITRAVYGGVVLGSRGVHALAAALLAVAAARATP